MDLLTPRAMRRSLPRLALAALAWFTLTGHVLSGCKGLFKPAIPEAPTGPPIQLDYSSPEATLKTMIKGIQAKGQGFSAWKGGFADSSLDAIGYHQFFDPADLQYFTAACNCGAPTDWGLSQESAFFYELVNVRPSDDYAAEFDSVETSPDPPPGENQAILYRKYFVFANSVDGGTSTIIAIGFADLTFTRISASRWAITTWIDHIDPQVGVNPSDPDQLTFGRRRLESTR